MQDAIPEVTEQAPAVPAVQSVPENVSVRIGLDKPFIVIEFDPMISRLRLTIDQARHMALALRQAANHFERLSRR